ncbi:SCO7613 C-terminal domain-containing membrane protein [Planosporangium mesophilum]|uniref:SCO7613 C-terminal domain-containing membrane protein n=1 Tax=Planosporangium mesophilum TaxID=689768 RepID=UPI0014391B68|nr:permease [Planosporangium mesophilum]NJC85002.1 permease [Planosporangium mesophilum]
MTRDEGCRRCGSPYDQDVAALAMFKRTVAALEAKKRQYEKDQLLLKTQLAHASAQRDSLARRVRAKFDREGAGRGQGRSLRSRITRRGDTDPVTDSVDESTGAEPEQPTAGAAPAPGATPTSGAAPHRTAPPTAPPGGAPPGRPGERPARAGEPGEAGERSGEPAQAGRPRRTGGLPPAIAGRLPGVLADAPPKVETRSPRTPRPPVTGPGRVGGAETTTATSQSALLAVGGLLLAGAAVVLAVFGFGSLGSMGRVALLTLATFILLMLPVRLAVRGLVATAETIASVGLLMVLLDGYVTWSLGLLGASFISTPVYFGFVCLATAAIATAYRGASHLIAPRYATVLVLQPVLPLLGYDWISGPAGWGLALAGVTALDLALGISLTRPGRFATLAGFVRPVRLHRPHHEEPEPVDDGTPPVRPESAPEEPEDVKTSSDFPTRPEPAPKPAPTPTLTEPAPAVQAPAILRDLTWVLFTVAFGASLAYATVALTTATTPGPAVRAALVLLLAAGLGLAGALTWRRNPLPDLAGGLATLAVVVAVTRVGMVALPGRALLFAALAVAVAAVVVPLLPTAARTGPRLASGVAAAVTGLVLLAQAVPAIVAPVKAAYPWWRADLPGYAQRIGDAAGPTGWQLVVAGALLTLAAALALPGSLRVNAALASGVLTILTMPAAWHLNWVVTPAVLVIAAVAVGASGLTARDEEAANGFVAAAGVLGGYAALTGLTHPAATSFTLAAITLGGYVIATLRPPRTDPQAELVGQRVGEWAAGGAAFALPGAVCAGLASLVREGVFPGANASLVLAGGFVAVSGTLGYSAYRLVSGRRESRPLLLGTSLGAFAVAIGALAGRGTTVIDMAVGILLATGAILLWTAPSFGSRIVFGQDLDGNDIAAAAVTASATAALARVLALAVPGIGLVTTAVLVVAVATAVRRLPARQRRGPVAGEMAIGAVIAAASGAAALGAAAGVIHAANPVWQADLGPAWGHTSAQYTPYGWQAPVALLLIALAAVIVVPRPQGEDIATVAMGLAAVVAPVALGLPWWSPMVVGLLAITGLGVAACLADLPRVAYTRVGVAGLLALYTAAASLVRPASTAATLQSIALVGTLVAALAGVRLADDRVGRAHLVPVGGGAVAAAVLSFTGAAAALSAGGHHPTPVVLAGALAATSLSLVVTGLACWRTPGFLPYLTAAVAVACTATALAALPHRLPLGLYGATGALLGVLAELMRVGAVRRIGWRPEDGWQPVADWSPGRGPRFDQWMPGRGWLGMGRWRPAGEPIGFGGGAAAASAVPAAIAVAAVALPLVAVLFGPYHFGLHPWTSTQTGAGNLASFNGWKAHATDVITMAVLTFAAALAALGLGGSREQVANRTVAVVVPGAALTLLLIPTAAHLDHLQATFALLVTTLCGLSLALTLPPAPDSIEGGPLRTARRLVFALAVLAAIAGQVGSLATRSMTIQALAGSVVVGAIGALWGRYPLARMIGWHVAVGTAQLLAFAASLAAGHPARSAAFPLLGVAAIAVALAATLPRLRPTVSVDTEATVIEATALLGLVGALVLTSDNTRYTALACTALGAILGLAALRPGRPEKYLQGLIFAAAAAEVVGVWLLMSTGRVELPEAYSLPFAVFALLVGVFELRRRPDLGSWLAYGPALVAGFAPSLALVLMADGAPARRVLVIVAGVLTLAVGSVRRQKAPVVVGSAVTAVATLHELLRLSAMLPWWVLLLLFSAAGALLISLGATYEKRRHNVARLRGAFDRLR